MTTPDMLSTITATKVPPSQRPAALPHIYGVLCTQIESVIFDTAGSIISNYKGAYWEFFRLSNGGFYMVPCLGGRPVTLRVTGNMYEGEMSEEAAGITCCLHAYSHASFAAREGSRYQQTLAEQFHLLRDFALDHPEAAAIFGAID